MPGGMASADRWTLIFANDASTSDDDVFGILVLDLQRILVTDNYAIG